MTAPAAAREKAREIAHRGTRCQGGEQLKQARGFHDHLWQCDAMTNEIQTALLAAEQRGREAAVPAWQPIETAPKDGTRILIGIEGGTAQDDVCDASWLDDGWYSDSGFEEPTHWQPLPAAPQPKEPPRFSEVRFTQNGNATSKESDDVGKA